MRDPIEHPAADSDDTSLDTDIARHLDGELDAERFVALNAQLARDPDAIDRLLVVSAQHAVIGEVLEHRAVDRAITQTKIDAELTARADARRRIAFAAAIAAALIPAVGWWVLQTSLAKPPAGSPALPSVDDVAASDRSPAPGERAGSIDLTREIFVDTIDAPQSIRLIHVADDRFAEIERPAVAMASTPIRLTLGVAHDPAMVSAGWSILGGTIESFPDWPATVSPQVDLNPSLKLNP